MSDRPEFSVYWVDPQGDYHTERRWIMGEDAVKFAYEFSHRPAARIGIVRRIIITDGDDCIVFEWKFGHGRTFPTDDDIAKARAEQVNATALLDPA